MQVPDLPPIFELNYSDSVYQTYLKVFITHVEIRKPKQSKYGGIGGMIRLGTDLAGLTAKKYLDGCFTIDQIERVEVKPATRHCAGLIQFYLTFKSFQTKANYVDCAYRSDVMNFSYKDREKVEAIKQYIEQYKRNV